VKIAYTRAGCVGGRGGTAGNSFDHLKGQGAAESRMALNAMLSRDLKKIAAAVKEENSFYEFNRDTNRRCRLVVTSFRARFSASEKSCIRTCNVFMDVIESFGESRAIEKLFYLGWKKSSTIAVFGIDCDSNCFRNIAGKLFVDGQLY
jgi:hypothetical protein